MKRPLRWLATPLLLLSTLLLPLLGAAQERGLEIDIVGGNASALPIAVVPMPYQGSAAAPGTDISAVIAADLARSRYDSGLASYLEILDADQQLFQQEVLLAQARGAELQARAALYRALGGGWQP